jgi:predicted CoA-substrate-specific enzyme activase
VNKRIGIDIGSLYISSVLLEDGQLLHTQYVEHRGNIRSELERFLRSPLYQSYESIGITGNFPGRKEGIIDNSLALIEGAKFLLPKCKNIFAIGGQTFLLIFYDKKGHYREHSINPPCAAGTGSFIEQQAERLNLSTAELSAKAAAYSRKTPLVATRCAVFAKTDIIHAMQEGYSLEAVCAGLCQGIARNVTDVLIKGRELHEPIGVIGGVSQNKKIISSIQEILGKRVTVPEHAQVAGAVGAALLGNTSSINPEMIVDPAKRRNVRVPLRMTLSKYPDFDAFEITDLDGVEVFSPKGHIDAKEGVFIGIDIGSTSTKAVIINRNKEIMGGFYTTTGGEPIAAVQKLIRTINTTFDGKALNILGVATTGSGRMIIKELFSADFVINEITAHAKAAVFLNPEVDTILEIGGQDSKFTRIRNGEVYFSSMNYVCAAGTGSFIEEQAKRLKVSLEEFSDMAFDAKAPYTSDRCTVYMERDLNVLLGEGWSKEALAAAVLHSVRDNYMAKVVSKSPLGDYIVFQGATGRNKALVAAFEQLLGTPIHVSPFCHLTGALGAALLYQEEFDERPMSSAFLWGIQDLKISEEVCERCSNNCLLTVVEKDGRKSGWGMKCGRDYSHRKPTTTTLSAPEKRFQEIIQPLYKTTSDMTIPNGITIGIPKALYNIDYAPLWYNFLSRLGFKVVVSRSCRNSLTDGKRLVNSDFCAPMVLSHGYVKQLLNRGVDYLFYPAVVNEIDPDFDGQVLFRKKTRDAYFCYYSQYLPSIVNKLTSIEVEAKLISPIIYFNQRNLEEIAANIYEELRKKLPDETWEVGLADTVNALIQSYEEYKRARRRWADTWEQLYTKTPEGKIRILLLGRPYVVFDPGVSLGILTKLEEQGAELYWQEELALENFEPCYAQKFYERMHWHYGKQIIKAAEFCAQSPDLFTVYLTCFRCSPDSFLLSYVKDIMKYYDKPFLILQLDEHSSDVGYKTRIEAGLQSFRNYMTGHKRRKVPIKTRARNDALQKGDTVLVANLDSVISSFWTASFKKAGYEALLLDPDERSLNTGYKFTSGGECMPLTSLIGGVIQKIREKRLNPEKTFFYIPTLCMACNFPNFPILSDLAFNLAGIRGLKIGLINFMTPGDVLPHTLAIKILQSMIIGSILYKLYHRIVPYEVEQGQTEKVLHIAKKLIYEAIMKGQDLRTSLGDAVNRFRKITRVEVKGRKPRIGLLGDLYVKFNDLVNNKIQNLVKELGGELIIPSLTEYASHFYDADIRIHGDDPRHVKILRRIERWYELFAEDLIGDQKEPDFSECVQLMKDYKITHYITGETSINVGRALYYIRNKLVDAILHLNPIFCCPGVVTSSIYRKIQEDFKIPIIDIFYDGTGNPNKVLIPHLHYLAADKG